MSTGLYNIHKVGVAQNAEDCETANLNIALKSSCFQRFFKYFLSFLSQTDRHLPWRKMTSFGPECSHQSPCYPIVLNNPQGKRQRDDQQGKISKDVLVVCQGKDLLCRPSPPIKPEGSKKEENKREREGEIWKGESRFTYRGIAEIKRKDWNLTKKLWKLYLLRKDLYSIFWSYSSKLHA